MLVAIPFRLRSVQQQVSQTGFFADRTAVTANLSAAARAYLAALGIADPDGDAEIAPACAATN